MANDLTSICKSVLQRLGVTSSFLSIDDDTRNGRALTICYGTTRDAELRKHPWRFAIKRQTLAPDGSLGDGVAQDFAYAFTLPADCLRILKPRDALLDWQLEGKKILTNQSDTLVLRYIARIEDVSLFDASFTDALIARMADAMCEAITQSTSKKAAILQDYKDAIAEARRNNAFETIPVEGQDGSWILARN